MTLLLFQLSLDATKAGVSVDLNVSFCAAAASGSELQIYGKVLKMGRKLAFTEVQISGGCCIAKHLPVHFNIPVLVPLDKDTGKLIATGRHTKAL